MCFVDADNALRLSGTKRLSRAVEGQALRSRGNRHPDSPGARCQCLIDELSSSGLPLEALRERFEMGDTDMFDVPNPAP